MRIKLFNRDGANLYLYRNDLAEPIKSHTYEWRLIIDSKHKKYILKYCRYIGKFNNIQAIDPPGGPFLLVGNVLENKYKIVQINSINSILISERD